MPTPTASSLEAAGWVVDASVTLTWFFPDEGTPFTERLLDELGQRPFWAPALWVLQCTNVLQSAQRRRRIDAHRHAVIAAARALDPPLLSTLQDIDRQASGRPLA